MTTPPRTVSIVGLLTSLVLGVVLLIGAFEIPVPSVSIQIGVDQAESGTEPVAATHREAAAEPKAPPAPSDASIPDAEPPTPAKVEVPPPPAPPVVPARPRLSSTKTGTSESRRASGSVEPPDPDLGADPTFTPFTVAPSILNRSEVVQAMEREYPPLLRDAGIGGQVGVYFFIDENGVVQNFRVETSSGHPALDDAALAVAGVYRFSPALNRDAPVPVWVQFTITFQVG